MEREVSARRRAGLRELAAPSSLVRQSTFSDSRAFSENDTAGDGRLDFEEVHTRMLALPGSNKCPGAALSIHMLVVVALCGVFVFPDLFLLTYC